ncbi:MAG: hypothetical protein JWM41_371 [Gemmatimonadetes bacterium]|nr:hypothetical protein [Gemmatimonadota bacterium]
MKNQLAVVRNLLAASVFALAGLGLTPARSMAATNAANKGILACGYYDGGWCVACLTTDFCVASCCGGCDLIEISC